MIKYVFSLTVLIVCWVLVAWSDSSTEKTVRRKPKQEHIAAFICSIVPIVLAVLCIPRLLRPVPGGGSCMPGMGAALVIGFLGFVFVVVTAPLAIISIILGRAALKGPAAKGRSLANAAIALGVLELAVVAYIILWVISLMM